jgi:hypothetical protein
MIHEISDPPPATLAAVSAPSSQPDPIIVPRLIRVSPRSPTARCRWFSPVAIDASPGEAFAMVFLQISSSRLVPVKTGNVQIVKQSDCR